MTALASLFVNFRPPWAEEAEHQDIAGMTELEVAVTGISKSFV